MTTTEEDTTLRLWFDAFDPAVKVELTPDEVIVRSTRARRSRYSVRCRRTNDLQQDLQSALAELVGRIS